MTAIACILSLTPQREKFLTQLLTPQYECLHFLWSTLNVHEQKQLEQLTHKLLAHLDKIEIKE